MRDKLLYVPKGAREFITKRLQAKGLTEYQIYCRIEKYLYLLHKIREQRIYGHSTKKNNGYSLLRRKYLEFYLSERLFDEIRDDLLKWGILHWDESYVTPAEAAFYGVAAKPQGYKLTEKWAAMPTIDEMVLNDKMAQKLMVKAMLVKYEKSTHQYLYDCLRYIEIDAEAAYAMTEELLSNSLSLLRSLPSNHYDRYMQSFSKHSHYKLSRNLEEASLDELEQDLIKRHTDNRILIQNIELGDIELKPDLYGRVHSVITNISSALRPYVRYCKQPDEVLWNVDIKNSQPFFLAVQLQQHYLGLDMPADVASFIQGCAEGDCYERFMRAAKLDQTNEDLREQVKRLLYKKTLFCKETVCDEEDNKVAHYFKSVYPNVLEYIKKVKTRTSSYNCYKEFGQGLQRTEASIIQKVVGQCRDKGIWILTIHDSIVTLEDHKDEVYRMIKEVCTSECLITPILSVKPLLPKQPEIGLYISHESSLGEESAAGFYKKDRYSLCTDNYNSLIEQFKKLKLEPDYGSEESKIREQKIMGRLVELRSELDKLEAKRRRQSRVNQRNMTCDYSHLQPLVEHFSNQYTTPVDDEDWDYRDALVRVEKSRLRSLTSCLTVAVSDVARWLEIDREMWYRHNMMKEGMKNRHHTRKEQCHAA